MAIDQKVIDELKAKHQDLTQLSQDETDILVKPPTRPQWKRFRAFMSDERKRPDAMEQLLRDCLVYPELTELDAMLERRPGLAESFGSSVVEMAGLTDRVEKKVL